METSRKLLQIVKTERLGTKPRLSSPKGKLCLVEPPQMAVKTISDYAHSLKELEGEFKPIEIVKAIRSLTPLRVLLLVNELLVISKKSHSREIREAARLKLELNDLEF